MNATAIRNVIVAIVLVLFCILIGSYAAEDKNVSVFMIAGIVGLIFMVILGRRAWILLYLLPPLVAFLPLGILERLPAGFLIAGLVLTYWTLMWIMGYVRFKWRTLPALDFIVLAVFLYYALTYYWHPVSINALGIEVEYVGGKEYVWCLLAVIYYVTLSCIPCSYEDLYGVLRKAMFLVVGTTVFVAVSGMFNMVTAGELQENMGNSRFSLFSQLGIVAFLIAFSKKTFHEILTSPKYIIIMLFCCAAVVISGWREKLVMFGAMVIAVCHIKRELAYLVFMGLAVYGTLLYLSEEKVVEEHFPFGMQRTLSILPGVQISDEVRISAENSSEWRKVMWQWALDPRTGYIEDYVWGDGFGLAVGDLNRISVSLMRGAVQRGDQERFASSGTWHNGPILAIHRTGIVGLALITITFLYGAFLIVRVCRAYRGSPMFVLAVLFLCQLYGDIAHFYVSAGQIHRFFDDFVYLALAKVLYCIGREEGIIVPVFSKGRYNPMLIAEQKRNELIQRGQQESIAIRRRG
ncbi:MAG: hypothetical protein MJ056_03170 [Akkermansia sp.]|nr:hypothetical protein [Akkermansia sp.]